MTQDADNKGFSRDIEVGSVSGRGTERRIEATAAERAALADLLSLQSIGCLQAQLGIRRLSTGLIEVKGRFAADVVQTCVVTLEPVPAKLADSFRVTFGEGDPAPELAEIDIDFEESDPPEPIHDGRIDLGAVVAEQLALALDPYPRKPDAELPQELSPGGSGMAPETKSIAKRKPFKGLDKLIRS